MTKFTLEPDKYITRRQLADQMGVTTQTVRLMEKNEALPRPIYISVGDVMPAGFYYRIEELDRSLINAQRNKAIERSTITLQKLGYRVIAPKVV
jgi:hypothetical protein